MDFVKDLVLADQDFHCPGRIDGILGAEIFPQLLEVNKVVSQDGKCCAAKSALGFMVMGAAPLSDVAATSHTFCVLAESPLESLVQRF